MLKKIMKLDGVQALSKNELKSIKGGFSIGPSSFCFNITDSFACTNQTNNQCTWYGCYCGPNYPHIAPCGG